MRNLKIGVKLYVVIAIALVGMVIIGAVAMIGMSSLNSQTALLADYWLPGVDEARAMDTNVSDTRLYVVRVAMATTQEQMEEYKVKVEEKIVATEEVQAGYKSLLDAAGDTADPIEVACFEEIIALWEQAKKYNEEIISLSNNGQKDTALTLLDGDSLTNYRAMSSKTAELVEFNTVGSDVAKSEAVDLYKTMIFLIIGVLIFVVILSVVIAYAIIRGIRRPIAELEVAAKKMTDGDLDVEISYESKDELGSLSASMRGQARMLKLIIEDETNILNKMAIGDFSVESSCTNEYVGAFRPLLESIHTIISRLSETMRQIATSADQVASGSEQVSVSAQSLAQGATEQAGSVEELAATINEISTKVNETAKNARDASHMVNTVADEMDQSNAKMQDMIHAMADINDSSNEIGKIIKTIEDIAFQTNILALNAAVEAARAGTAGKGFAVVADEVRSLAGKSAEASKNTAALIEKSIQYVQNGSKLADETAQSLTQVVEGAKQATDIVNRISTASEEQAAGIEQVKLGVDQISNVVQTNSATAEESAAASEELSGQSQLMKELVSAFQLKNADDQDMSSLSFQEDGNAETTAYSEKY